MTPLIILVDQSGLVVAAPNLSDVVKVEYPPGTVQELELVNPNNIKLMIEQMIQQYQLFQSEVMIILDNSVYFQKDIPTQDPVDQEKFMSEFESSVPLGSVFVRKYELEQKTHVIAFNKQFYKALVRSLIELGFTPKVLVPDMITIQLVGVSGLTKEIATLLAQAEDKLQKHSLLSPADTPQAPAPETVAQPTQVAVSSQPTSKIRVYLMLGLFVILISVLVWMLIANTSAQTTS